jgi:predicted transposase YbfD/YdcC
LERRQITTTTWLNDYLEAWPQVGQVFRLERTRKSKGGETTEVLYGITDLTRQDCDAAGLLHYSRSHWGIENSLHYRRDETFGEDRCRARRGQGPRVLATLRNVAIHFLHDYEAPSMAAATRELAAYPEKALELIFHAT